MQEKENIIKQNILSFFYKTFQSLSTNDLIGLGTSINELFQYMEQLKKQQQS